MSKKLEFHDRLQGFIAHLGLKPTSFEAEMGFSNGSIGKAINEKRALTSDRLETIFYKYPELNAEWLLTGKGAMLKESAKNIRSSRASGNTMPLIVTVDTAGRNAIIQVDTKAAAGLPANFDNPEYLKNLPAFHLPDPQFRVGTFMRIQISGDSMHPTIKHKDWVFAELIHDFADIRDGYIHIILTRDGVVAKRILNRIDKRSKLVLQSDNTSYSTYEEDIDDVLQIWKVHAKLSFDLGNDNADLRKDINWLKAEMIELKGKIK